MQVTVLLRGFGLTEVLVSYNFTFSPLYKKKEEEEEVANRKKQKKKRKTLEVELKKSEVGSRCLFVCSRGCG